MNAFWGVTWKKELISYKKGNSLGQLKVKVWERILY
jgi:hypothetical protein